MVKKRCWGCCCCEGWRTHWETGSGSPSLPPPSLFSSRVTLEQDLCPPLDSGSPGPPRPQASCVLGHRSLTTTTRTSLCCLSLCRRLKSLPDFSEGPEESCGHLEWGWCGGVRAEEDTGSSGSLESGQAIQEEEWNWKEWIKWKERIQGVIFSLQR